MIEAIALSIFVGCFLICAVACTIWVVSQLWRDLTR